MENDIKNEIKVKTKYWHKCQGCSRRHSTKIKKDKIKFLIVSMPQIIVEKEDDQRIYQNICKEDE